MIVIEDDDFDAAVISLHNAGFCDAPWSYGSIVDPAIFKDKRMQEIHRATAIGYQNLNKNSNRFVFPRESKVKERAVLLRSSYVHLSLLATPQSEFTCIDNLHYPSSKLLLESFVRTHIRDPDISMWTTDLEMWAVSYLYCRLKLDDDVLDSSSDEGAKTWFNENILRDSGGVDRTVTKRLGRKTNKTEGVS